MRIAVISDTHMPRGNRRLPEDCVERLRAADLIVHAGDLMRITVLHELESYGPVVAVHGNVDDAEVRAALPPVASVQAAGATIAVVHDAGPARGRLERMRKRFPEADAVVFGHSHLPLQEHSPRMGFRSSIRAARPSRRRRAPAHDRDRDRVRRAGGVRAHRRRLTNSPAMDLSVFFAGTAGSIPTARRGLPAVLVRRGGDRILFDCGEGTQRQLVQSVGLTELTEVFLTHFHADHWLGLPGLLKTFDLRARERALAVHGPPGLRDLLTLALRAAGRVRFELDLIELAPGDLLERDGYKIAPVPVAHRGGNAFGYVIYEDARPGEFDPDAATALGVVPGPEFGRLQRGETIRGVRPEQVLGPARAGRKVVISGDTSPCETLAVASHEADLLLHEATFAEEERERAAETGHSTAGQAATLAREAGVAMLALTHFSTRYPVGVLRDEGACRNLPADRAPTRLRHRDRDPVSRAWRARARAVGGSAGGRGGRGGGGAPQAAEAGEGEAEVIADPAG